MLKNDPRYQNMDIVTARFILARYDAEFGTADPKEAMQSDEGRIAFELYCIALGWLIETGKWHHEGIDAGFVAALGWA